MKRDNFRPLPNPAAVIVSVLVAAAIQDRRAAERLAQTRSTRP